MVTIFAQLISNSELPLRDSHLRAEINQLTVELTLSSEEVQTLVQKRTGGGHGVGGSDAIPNLPSTNNNNEQRMENGIRPNVSQ